MSSSLDELYSKALDAAQRHPVHLSCSMTNDCKQPISWVDNKGYVYCAFHGQQRRTHGTPSRKMTGAEIKKLERGEPIRYRR